MQQLTDMNITGLTADSRAVKPGYLFAALPGTLADGRAFIPEAVERGAIAVLAPNGTTHDDSQAQIITDANPRQAFSVMASRFYRKQPETAVAVTGTNGKTSVAHFLNQIWTHAGQASAALGTLGVITGDKTLGGSLTTPDPVALHQTLAELCNDGVDHVVLEASSHGLDQYRLDGVKLKAAAFTNLSRDHLDYHKTMTAYLAAKIRLFTDVLAPGGSAVINADSPECESIVAACAGKGHTVYSYGFHGESVRLHSIEAVPEGQALSLTVLGKTETVVLPLVGTFQVMNALCAAGLALATGFEPYTVFKSLAQLKGVPGRMELAGTRANGAQVFVDYAHTPDALTTALNALRPHVEGRLSIVFGAGGDRDQGKRQPMGVAASSADRVFITDDNPRSEDPGSIRKEILKGCATADEIGDRKTAIETAVNDLSPGDALLVAGKGHETGQIVGDKKLPFDDRDIARAAISQADRNS